MTAWQLSFPSFSMSHVSKSGLGTGVAGLQWWGPCKPKRGEAGLEPGKKRGKRGNAEGEGGGDRKSFGLERMQQ